MNKVPESFKEVVDNIVAVHHSFLRKHLPKVTGLFDELTPQSVDGAALDEARQLFTKIRKKIETHLQDEESFLFPTGIALESGQQPPPCEMDLRARLEEMEKEHDGCGKALTTVCQMLEGVAPNATREQLTTTIKLIQEDLDVHVEKENNYVHPRFLELIASKVS